MIKNIYDILGDYFNGTTLVFLLFPRTIQACPKGGGPVPALNSCLWAYEEHANVSDPEGLKHSFMDNLPVEVYGLR